MCIFVHLCVCMCVCAAVGGCGGCQAMFNNMTALGKELFFIDVVCACIVLYRPARGESSEEVLGWVGWVSDDVLNSLYLMSLLIFF